MSESGRRTTSVKSYRSSVRRYVGASSRRSRPRSVLDDGTLLGTEAPSSSVNSRRSSRSLASVTLASSKASSGRRSHYSVGTDTPSKNTENGFINNLIASTPSYLRKSSSPQQVNQAWRSPGPALQRSWLVCQHSVIQSLASPSHRQSWVAFGVFMLVCVCSQLIHKVNQFDGNHNDLSSIQLDNNHQLLRHHKAMYDDLLLRQNDPVTTKAGDNIHGVTSNILTVPMTAITNPSFELNLRVNEVKKDDETKLVKAAELVSKSKQQQNNNAKKEATKQAITPPLLVKSKQQPNANLEQESAQQGNLAESAAEPKQRQKGNNAVKGAQPVIPAGSVAKSKQQQNNNAKKEAAKQAITPPSLIKSKQQPNANVEKELAQQGNPAESAAEPKQRQNGNNTVKGAQPVIPAGSVAQSKQQQDNNAKKEATKQAITPPSLIKSKQQPNANVEQESAQQGNPAESAEEPKQRQNGNNTVEGSKPVITAGSVAKSKLQQNNSVEKKRNEKFPLEIDKKEKDESESELDLKRAVWRPRTREDTRHPPPGANWVHPRHRPITMEHYGKQLNGEINDKKETISNGM